MTSKKATTVFERFLFWITRSFAVVVSVIAIVGIAGLVSYFMSLDKKAGPVLLADIAAPPAAPAASGTAVQERVPGAISLPDNLRPYLGDAANQKVLQGWLTPLNDAEKREFISNLSGVVAEAETKNAAIPAVIGSVASGHPADVAGLRAGDLVLSVNGSPVKGWMSFINDIRPNPDTVLAVVVQRGGQQLTLNVTPERIIDEQGESVGHIGIDYGNTFAGFSIDDVINKYKTVKLDRLQPSEAETYQVLAQKAGVVAGVFGLFVVVALMSMLLVMLAIERNTRRDPA